MSRVRREAEALRDECERLARAAELEMLRPELTLEQRRDAMERAKVYWQMSRDWADTVAQAADVYPTKFTGKNVGTQSTTEKRKTFLKMFSRRLNTSNYEAIAATAMKDEAAGDLWQAKKGEELRSAVLNFLKRHKPLKDCPRE